MTGSPRLTVGKITAVIDTAGHPLGFGFSVVVVPHELTGAGHVHQLADDAGCTRFSGVDVDDRHPVGQRAQRTFRGVGGMGHGHAALAGAETVDYLDAEPLGEPVQIPWCTFIAVRDP